MEKSVYCFIGSESHIGDIKLEKFGAEISLTPDEAFNALDGGAQLLPKDEFDATFTEQERDVYPYPAFRADAPEAFTQKYRAALVSVAKHVEQLRAQKVNS